MGPRIHHTAVVASGAVLGEGCVVGPYCVIGSRAVVGNNCVLHGHSLVDGRTLIGDGCTIFPFAVVGMEPQDRKHRESEAESRLEIEPGCVIREHVTVNGGSSTGGNLTKVGRNTLLLAGSHVGHDCQIGSGVVVSNGVQLAGHVRIGDFATIGGSCSIRQFVNIGRLSMIAGASAVDKHVLPYSIVQGNRAVLKGANIVGLRRRKVNLRTVRVMQDVFGAFKQHSLQPKSENSDLVSFAMLVKKHCGGMFPQSEEEHSINHGLQMGMLDEIAAFALCEDFEGTLGQYDWGWKQKRLGHVL